MSSSPVTVLVSRRVALRDAAAFEAAMGEMVKAASAFTGHLGGYVIAPARSDGDLWHTLFAFDTVDHLRAWTDSDARRRWLDRVESLSSGASDIRIVTGLETWFALPGARIANPPPRWKMALTTWLGIFPLVLAFSALIGPLLQPIQPALSVAIVTALVTVAMTWLVMPTLTRLLAHWLYPRDEHSNM